MPVLICTGQVYGSRDLFPDGADDPAKWYDRDMLKDADIREPLFVFLEKEYGIIRIIEETRASESIADVIMVTPYELYGIEIKSDADSYARLSSQVKNYDECFDRNIAVVGTRHAEGFETKKGKYGDVGTVTYGDGEETLGILVHVDVVPEGDREKWNTDPFELVLNNGHLYGRGVVDDKGPVIASLYAMKYLKDSGIRPGKRIMLIVGTREEIVWEDMDHFKEEFPLPDYGFSPDGAFPIYNRENGYMDVELIFTEPLLKGDEDIRGGSATNSIPAEASAIINGELLRYKGKNAHSSVPEMGFNAIALMCGDLAEKTGYCFAKFMA